MPTPRDPPAPRWSEGSLERFQSIWKEVFREELEIRKLEISALYLLNFYLSVYGNPRKLIKNQEQKHD